jgi:hypothetical protein
MSFGATQAAGRNLALANEGTGKTIVMMMRGQTMESLG